MQINIDPKFPHGMSDDELSEAIDNYAVEMSRLGQGNPNYIPYYAPMIQLGLAVQDARRNKKTTLRTLGVSFVSLIVAGTALVVAVTGNQNNTALDEREIAAIERLTEVLSNDDEPASKPPQP